MTWAPDETTHKSDGKADTAIVPYVQVLNEADIDVDQSCAGHAHENGYKSDGYLWLGVGSLTPETANELRKRDGIYGCYRHYFNPPIDGEAWCVQYPGMSEGEETLRRNMKQLFDVLGVEMP